MAFSKATLVQEVRYALNDTPPADSITGSYSAAGLTLSVADATLYDKGDILEFKTDGDTFLVDSASGTTITMIAAGLSWDGSINANHASGAIFFLRPAFRYLQIVEAIEETILTLWPYGYKAVTDTLTPVAGTKWYDAATSTTNGIDIIDAVQRDTNTTAPGVVFYGGRRNFLKITLHKNLPTAVATSGQGYEVPKLHNTTYTISVRVRAKLTAAVSGGNYSDLTAGTLTDAIVYGACARLTENSEIPRVSQSDVSMGDATVNPGARLRDGAYFDEKYRRLRVRLKQELDTIYRRTGP
jgi:hypothetical protein